MAGGLHLVLLPCALLLIMNSHYVHIEAQQTLYRIVHQMRFETQPNTVTLVCEQTDGQTFPPGISGSAYFWVNDTMDQNLRYGPGESSWTFIISRDFEGEYFCGPNPNSLSNKEEIIYRPVYNRTLAELDEHVVRVETGETAIIPPYIGPGRWHSRYYIDWKDADGTLVSRVDGLRRSSSIPFPERYSVDGGDFTLQIQRITRSDAGKYIGELGVTEGATNHYYFPLKNTSLVVYERPKVTRPPEPVVIQHQNGTSVTFTCTAQGFPRPTITWAHNNESATVSRYISTNFDIGDDTAQSVLTIKNVTAQDSGQVVCTALVAPGGEVTPLKITAEAGLSVLEIVRAVVRQTVDGGLFFVVYIAKKLLTEVHIHLAFKGAQTITSENSFHGGKKLSFFLDKPPFPVNHFTVNVTVMNGNVGSKPFVIVSNEVLSECDEKVVTVIVPVALALLGVIIVSALLFLLLYCCLIKCYRHKTLKLILKHAPEEDKKEIIGCTVKSLYGRNPFKKTNENVQSGPPPIPSSNDPVMTDSSKVKSKGQTGRKKRQEDKEACQDRLEAIEITNKLMQMLDENNSG